MIFTSNELGPVEVRVRASYRTGILIYPSKMIVMELLAAYIYTRLLDQIGERFLLNYNLPCPTCCLPNPERHALSFKTSFWLRNPHDKEATTGKSYYGDASLYFLRADGEEAPKNCQC